MPQSVVSACVPSDSAGGSIRIPGYVLLTGVNYPYIYSDTDIGGSISFSVLFFGDSVEDKTVS